MRRLAIILGEQEASFPLGNRGQQVSEVACDGGQLGADAGRLAVRALEKPLGGRAALARRLPDPRAAVRPARGRGAADQEVYPLRAGYPDPNDAPDWRPDPLFQILAAVAPYPERPLAKGRTRARFRYACTRRQAALPPAERPVRLERRAAPCRRLQVRND